MVPQGKAEVLSLIGLRFRVQGLRFWTKSGAFQCTCEIRPPVPKVPHVVRILGLYWGIIEIMENRMETTVYGLITRIQLWRALKPGNPKL